ncbi:hypothetical protein T265_07268 [Opisthorchis viverrini]|uniref:Uncharacterized protein n=1 Tax=Opisthorchis viverrini TaxID=6198 RepID=A0A074ZHM7_OPIVI|nr:hypothetical protein T265_07268 [Opisthorchis viverrini]KER25227.1 hypothetical protein T265_07268 [Opisthorchis viverrini]
MKLNLTFTLENYDRHVTNIHIALDVPERIANDDDGRGRVNLGVSGSNPTSASRLPLSGLGQLGSIQALVVPLGGMAVRDRKGATAERFFSWKRFRGEKYLVSLRLPNLKNEHAFTSKAWLYVSLSCFPVIETVAAGTNVPMAHSS